MVQNGTLKLSLWQPMSGNSRIEMGCLKGFIVYGLLAEFTDRHRDKDENQVTEFLRMLEDRGILELTVISGEPDQGLLEMQLFSLQMFEKATRDFRMVVVKMYEGIVCKGKVDYHIWQGVFLK